MHVSYNGDGFHAIAEMVRAVVGDHDYVDAMPRPEVSPTARGMRTFSEVRHG